MVILQENGRIGVTGDNPTLTAGLLDAHSLSISICIFTNMVFVHRPEITASEN